MRNKAIHPGPYVYVLFWFVSEYLAGDKKVLMKIMTGSSATFLKTFFNARIKFAERKVGRIVQGLLLSCL